MELPFERPRWKAAEPPPAEDLAIPEEPEPGYTLGSEDRSDDLVVPADEPAAGGEVVPPVATRRERSGTAPRRRAPAGAERGMVWAILVILAVILAGYGALARALIVSPDWCDEVLGHLPFIGGHTNERLLLRKVVLSDVVVTQARIKDGKAGTPVVVITGKALNNAGVGLHSIQISGRILGQDGLAIREKTIYCGNSVSVKVLKDLTKQEVTVLQALTPPKSFAVAPGETSSFAIIFLDPPPAAAEAVAQVVAAHSEG